MTKPLFPIKFRKKWGKILLSAEKTLPNTKYFISTPWYSGNNLALVPELPHSMTRAEHGFPGTRTIISQETGYILQVCW
jgi:hypothetical protein